MQNLGWEIRFGPPPPRPPSGPSSFTPNKNRSIPVEISSNVPQLSRRDVRRILGLWSILVPRIVKLLGQRADAARDSGVVELLPQKLRSLQRSLRILERSLRILQRSSRIHVQDLVQAPKRFYRILSNMMILDRILCNPTEP